jgi:antiviral helicase SKI2
MLLLPEYQSRVAVLKTLDYIDEHSAVQLKGRVACEINTTDELLTTELLFNNAFSSLESAEIVALLSCMVFQEKNAAPPKLNVKLQQGHDQIVNLAKQLVTIQREHGVNVAMDQVLGGLKFGLVQVVHEWALGKPFKEITELTDVLEGSIVRCIVRLDETCRELRSAAKLMGDPSLHRKMEEAGNMIKRDICFASSLYY